MAGLIEGGVLAGGDGAHYPETAGSDRLSAPGHDVDYRLTDHVARVLRDFDIDLDALHAHRRPLIRYCLDWSEQRHHLAGSLGAALAERMLEIDWLRRTKPGRPAHRRREKRPGRRLRPAVRRE